MCGNSAINRANDTATVEESADSDFMQTPDPYCQDFLGSYPRSNAGLSLDESPIVYAKSEHNLFNLNIPS